MFCVLRLRNRDILVLECLPEHALDEPLRVFGHDFEFAKEVC